MPQKGIPLIELELPVSDLPHFYTTYDVSSVDSLVASPVSRKLRWGHIPQGSMWPLSVMQRNCIQSYTINQLEQLAFSDPEHFSPTDGTSPLRSRLAILHGYALGVFHFSLGTTLHAICLHLVN